MRMKVIALSAVVLLGVLLTTQASARAASEVALEACEASSDAVDALSALAAKPGPTPDATCTATCSGGSTVSCGGTSTCNAVNAACPSQQGYVTCGSTTTWCPACPPPPGCVGVPACTSSKQCSITYCGGVGMGSCNNGCCYCL